MKQLSLAEAKDRQEELDLTPAFIYNIEKGNIELYEYQTQEERKSLLQKDWCYDSEQDKIIGLRINGAILTTESVNLAKDRLERLKQETHMKLYKKTENFLTHEAIKCGENFEKETKRKVNYIGIHSLLGSYLRVKINGQFYRFNENDHTLVGRWV